MRRCPALVALLVLALAATAACSGGSDEPERLVVIDLNILHGIGGDGGGYERIFERIDLIAAALAEAQPDVIFLQEVLTGAGPDYPDVKATLLAALGEGYATVFGDITGQPIGEPGLGQLTLTRLPVVGAEGRVNFNARSTQRVTVETTFGPLDLYNAHLEGAGAVVDVTADDALDEIRGLLSFIGEAGDERPAVLAGDFNALPQHVSIRALRDAGFVDALAAAGDASCEAPGDPGCTSSTRPLSDNPDNLASKRIDYVWVRSSVDQQLTVERAELFLNEPAALADGGLLWPSDHIGVLAEIRLE